VQGRPERAIELARQAVEAMPSAMNYDVLAFALYVTGDLPRAVEAIETATRLEPANEGFRARYAEIRRRMEEGERRQP
jgi:cytochrome c-type biogenesis protein CcmH/NrfG